ncbi:hypothetical protein H5410_001333, partial [Solanum commersonii]
FWDPDRVVFAVKDFELTPKLEEICYFISLKKKFLRYLGLKNEKKLRCFKHNWVSLDYLYERYGRSDSYKFFRKEFSCTYVHWQARRPIAFAVALLGTLVFPREHGHISTCICSWLKYFLKKYFELLGNVKEGRQTSLKVAIFFYKCGARGILHKWNNILTIDIGNRPEREIPEYLVWLREDRNSSLEGEQGFEDIGTTIWIRHSHLGTKVITPEMWAQMKNIMQYLDNAGAGPKNVRVSSSLPPLA